MFIPNAYVRGFRAFVQKATMDRKRNGEREEKNDESNKIYNQRLRNHENIRTLLRNKRKFIFGKNHMIKENIFKHTK